VVLERFCQIFSFLYLTRDAQLSCAKPQNYCFLTISSFGDLVMVLTLMTEVEVVWIVTRVIVLIGCEQLCLFLKLLIFHLKLQVLVPL
jgi:hypothetical protein